MKKILFFSAMLVTVAANAQTMDINIATIDYSTKIAVCNLSWTARNATHLSDVWVFVDYIEISGNATTGSWQPAAITGATVTQKTTGNATASTVSDNTRGVWIKSVTSGANFTGQIALQLSSVSAKFNACAYATDYPPNAATYNAGTYTLKGTKPFTINNNVPVNDTKYSGVINAITDATGCPGVLGRDVPVNGATCAPGLTAVNGYCRDLVADGASVKCGLEIISIGNISYSHLAPSYVTSGWRLPNYDEACCFGGGPGHWCIINNHTCHVPDCYNSGDVLCTLIIVR
jgi:hypothetical protein